MICSTARVTRAGAATRPRASWWRWCGRWRAWRAWACSTATQKRELGRLRDRPRATRVNGASAQAARGGAGVTAMRSTRRAPAQGWPELLAGVLGGAVALARRARAARARAARVAAAGWAAGRRAGGRAGGVGGERACWCWRPRARCWCGRCGCGGCGVGSGAGGSTRGCRRSRSGGCGRCRRVRSRRSVSRRAARSRISRRGVSGWRRRSGCASCASRATPRTRRAAR